MAARALPGGNTPNAKYGAAMGTKNAAGEGAREAADGTEVEAQAALEGKVHLGAEGGAHPSGRRDGCVVFEKPDAATSTSAAEVR